MRILVIGSLVGLLFSACAASKPSSPGQMEASSTGTGGKAAATRYHSFSGTVQAVDAGSRKLTLKGEYGHIETINVPPEVKEFEKISVGDTVEVEVREGVLFEYQRAGNGGAPAPAREAEARAPTDQPPRRGRGGAVQTTVTVTAIDLESRVVHVQDAEGYRYEVRASPTLAIEKLKVGDRLLATYVATAAISVSKKANP